MTGFPSEMLSCKKCYQGRLHPRTSHVAVVRKPRPPQCIDAQTVFILVLSAWNAASRTIFSILFIVSRNGQGNILHQQLSKRLDSSCILVMGVRRALM